MQNPSVIRHMRPSGGEQASILLADMTPQAPVWGYDGIRLGYGRALAIDQASGQSLCLLVGRGRTLRRLRPIPWAALRYDDRLQAFLADVSADLFARGPIWSSGSAQRACVRRAHLYYDVYHEREAQP